MAVFDEEIATALELITENGQSCQLKVQAVAEATLSEQPWRPGAALPPVSFPVKGVFVPYKESKVDGDRVLAGDNVVYLPAFGTVPTSLDMLYDASGVAWTIQQVQTIAPNGEVILHILQVRR